MTAEIEFSTKYGAAEPILVLPPEIAEEIHEFLDRNHIPVSPIESDALTPIVRLPGYSKEMENAIDEWIETNKVPLDVKEMEGEEQSPSSIWWALEI